MKAALFSLVLAALLPVVQAVPSVDPAAARTWAGNIGWLDWRADSANGVEISQFTCSGFIYSANIGWINLGSGRPANYFAYQNNSAVDFGVNVDSSGRLRGYAWGANVGWISFENSGNPRLDFLSGQLTGHAWGANVGWINLGDVAFKLRVASVAAGQDSDGDRIPDGWEMANAGNLTLLSARGDVDGDGLSDFEEYNSDTDPTDDLDNLKIFELALAPDLTAVEVFWTTKSTRLYRVQMRSSLNANANWEDAGVGLLSADGPSLRRRVLLKPGTSTTFFRIQAVRPLAP